MSLEKIKDKTGFRRDSHSRGIINTDEVAYEAYMARRNSVSEKDKKIESLEQEVKELKELVQKMVNNGALNH